MQQRFNLLDIANGSLKDAKTKVIVDEQDSDKHFQCMLCLFALCCCFLFLRMDHRGVCESGSE